MSNIKIPLRELNYAKTKYNILDSFLKFIKVKSYEDITITEICDDVPISRGTFFNYYPSKEHIYTFFGWNFCAGLYVDLKEEKNKLNSIDKIKYVFEYTINQDEKYEHQFSSFISHILRRDLTIINEVSYTKADFLYKYPDKEHLIIDSENFKMPTVAEIFLNLLEEGINRDELKSDLDIKKTMWSLLSIYFSPPIIYKFTRQESSLNEVYDALLNDILKPLLITD